MSFLDNLLIKTAPARNYVKDHESGIEIGAGIICFALSVYAAAKAGIKTKEIMEDYNKKAIENEVHKHEGIITVYEDKQQEIIQYTEEDYKRDMRKLKMRTAGKVAVAWAPSALGFAGGTGLVLRSHHVMVKSNLGLAAALKASEETLERYRNKIEAKVGEDEEKKIYEGKEEVKKEGKKKPEVLQGTPLSPYARLMSRDTLDHDSDWCVSSNDYNMSRIKSAEIWANRQLALHGKLTFNKILEHIGLPQCDEGDVVGWKLIKCGGKTDYDGIHINVIQQIGGNVNDVHYVKDEWTDSMVRAADPFWIDFNVEGCILSGGVINKLGG